MKILIVEDDSTLNRLLTMHLSHRGFEAISALGGAEGLRSALDHNPDLVLLDVMMPAMDGWEVCQRLRTVSTIPIIMLTAKTMTHDVIHGLELGADDYVKKPFNLRELDLRIDALLRRSQLRGQAAASGHDTGVLFDDAVLAIDEQRRRVTRRGKSVHLTPTEFRLLLYLVRHQGKVVPHEELLTEVWGPEYAHDTSVLSVYIRYLRQKVEDCPNAPQYIHTEWRMGYRFAPFRMASPD